MYNAPISVGLASKNMVAHWQLDLKYRLDKVIWKRFFSYGQQRMISLQKFMKKDPTYLIYLYLFIVIVLTGLLSCASSLSLSLSLSTSLTAFVPVCPVIMTSMSLTSSVEIYIHFVIHGPILSKIYKYPVLRFLIVFWGFYFLFWKSQGLIFNIFRCFQSASLSLTTATHLSV